MWSEDKISVNQGIVRPASLTDAPNSWVDGNLIRWVDGVLRPVGGWDKMYLPSALSSKVRAVHSWTDNSKVFWTAFLCEGHVYVIKEDGTLYNISPTIPLVAPYSDVTAGGYGDYTYSYGTYGTPRPTTTRSLIVGTQFTLSNWGQNLLIMSSADGRLLMWDPSTPSTVCSSVTNAPTGNRTFVVTDERHVVIFGAGGIPNRLIWSDQENINNWNIASVTSKSGDYYIEPSAPIIGAKLTPYGTLFFTSVAVYMLRFVGLPYVYSYDKIGDRATPITGSAVAQSGSQLIWLADDGFWRYDGNTVTKVDSPLSDYVKQRRDPLVSRFRTFAFNLGSYDELWFHFPSVGSQECDQYVSFNPHSGWWSKGYLSRTCGHPATFTSYPIMSDGYNIYQHEKGSVFGASQSLPFVQMMYTKGAFGDITLHQLAPTFGSANYTKLNLDVSQLFVPDISPGDPVPVSMSGITCNSRGLFDIRKTAPAMLLKFYQSADNIGTWSIGNLTLWYTNRGRRRHNYKV